MAKATKGIIVAFIASLLLAVGCYLPQEAVTPQTPSASEGLEGDSILFATFTTGSYESLYLLDISSIQVTKLIDVDIPGEMNWPPFSLSRDGECVAYFSSDSYLSILNLNDGKVTKIIEASQEAGDRYVAWSPDDSRITYVCGRHLYLVNADGTADKALASPKGGLYTPGGTTVDQIRHPVWSADGERILFDDFRAPPEMYGGSRETKNRSVYTVNIDSGEKTSLFERAEVQSPKSYGNELLIKGYNEEGLSTLFIMSDDGTKRKELPELWDAYHFRWSPDGDVIAYITRGLNPELKMIDTTRVAEIELRAQLEVNDLIWSPDSQHIAYVKRGLGITDEIHIVRRDCSGDFFVYQLPEPPETEYIIRNIVLIAWLR